MYDIINIFVFNREIHNFIPLFLKDEIVELEAKLAMLKEKEAKFTEVIQLEETKIKSVQMTFSTQQSRLDKQQHEIEAREKSLEEELVS